MWIVVCIASGQNRTEEIRRFLESEGVMVKIRPAFRKAANVVCDFEIAVLESEAEEARQLLIEGGFE